MSHVIRSGETLGEIAQRYNVTVAQILAANPRIRNANRIRIGQVIKIPGRRIRYSNTPRSVRSSKTLKTTRIPDKDSSETSETIEVENIYQIRRGDSLDKIARRYNVTVEKLLKANPSIKNANRIRIGQKIIIPKDSFFTQVKKFFTFKWLHEPENKYVEVNPYDVADENEVNAAEVVLDKDGSIIPDNTEITEEEQFNRKKFFTAYREIFGSLRQHQVNGLGSLLMSFEQDKEITNLQYMAYMLATIKHETANRFQPITEYGGRSYFSKYDPSLANTSRRRARAKRNGNTQRGDGYKYRGRGFVQITWKNNYQKLGDALGYDLVNNPEKALDPVIAYKIMSYGMREGIFTGRRLSHYISSDHTDYKNARKIINGLDKARLVQRHAQNFEKILRKAAA